MSPPLLLVDYGIGNLGSAMKAFRHLGAEAVLSGEPRDLATAGAIVLPGDGAFGASMDELRGRGLLEPLLQAVRGGTPLLGICIGMQLLFEESDEFGPVRGLGVLPGRVVRFPPHAGRKVPQMGWNTLCIRQRTPMLEGIEDGAWVYFVHSYYPVPAEPALVATSTPYGAEFASSVGRDNVFGTQFHPEKSQQVGLRLLANFVRLVERS